MITGGSDGIGRAVATLLAADGDTRVTLVARNAAKTVETLRGLRGEGHDHLVADLSRMEDVKAIARRLADMHYDIFINNAGVGLYGRFGDMSLDEQLRMMRLNMESVVVLSHEYLRRARRGDALVNTASFLAYAPLPGAAVYSATKAFVAALSETLWWEYRKSGVYVFGFSPGVVATSFHAAAGGSAAHFPRVLGQSAEDAARELVTALRKRTSPRAIAGFGTRAFIRMQRLISRRMTINMMGTSSPIQSLFTTKAQ
jgi:short-subunit dehydrogenase